MGRTEEGRLTRVGILNACRVAPLPSSVIATRLGKRQNTVSMKIQEFVDAGYLEKLPKSMDYKLTPSGLVYLKTLAK